MPNRQATPSQVPGMKTKWTHLLGAAVLSSLLGATPVLAQGTSLGEALAAKENGEFKTAIIVLKNALQKDAENPEARYLLGQIYLDMGIGSGAEKELRWARRLGVSDDEVLFKLGQSYLLQEQYRRIRDELTISPDMAPKLKAELTTLYGLASLAEGNERKARQDFEEAIRIYPDLSDAHLGMARVDMANDNRQAAELSLDTALEINSKCAECWVMKGEIRRKEQSYEVAREAFRNALDIEPANLLANLGKAAAEIELGNFDDVEPHLEAVKAIQPNHPLVSYLSAVLAFRDKDMDRAGQLVDDSLKAVPGHLPSLLLGGTVAFGQGQYAKASDSLRRYLDRVPNNAAAIKLLAASELRQRRGAEAIEILRPLIRSGSKDSQALALFGSAFFQTGDHDTGVDYLRQAQQADPDAANIRTQLALSQLATGDTDAAIEGLQSASEIDSNLLQADVLLVMAQLQKKDYDAAITAADKLSEKLTDSPVPANLRGVALLGKEDKQGARAAFEEAVRINPQFTTAQLNLARLDVSEERPVEATERLQAILDYDAKNTAAMLELSRLAEAEGKRDQALDWV
ncbi:MAG: XrtA/PEP-CTERM system TPR-repeat protein PrsT, partial [Gammaproteobacteria bacterium]